MLIKLNFKTNDVIYHALEDYEPKNEEEFTTEEILAQMYKKIEKHIKYGECLTVYYNTETDKLEFGND